jgi:isopentenyldiphosphate isomerase
VNPADEPVDVIDKEDRVVATVTRGEVRRRHLLHRCTYVLLRNASGEVLVHRRN